MARVGGDAELLRELAVLFIEEYPVHMAALREALERGDATAVERTAHSLKGAVANFGAQPAVAAALEIEKCGKNGQLEPVSDIFRALDLVLLALHAELVLL
jgi:HPt (histidine-containing phosphotransfer) domain-containing protein